MPPNLDSQLSDEEVPRRNDNVTIILRSISDHSLSSLSDIYGSEDSFIDTTNVDVGLEESLHPPLEQSLRDLLVQVTNTEDLTTVTQLKLRVISRETTLQYLSFYTPALRELTLDGSVVSSLRDLGFGLKNLKILKVNRCGLTCIDGVFGFEHLEELYIANNEINTLSPCAFLNKVRVLDVRRNMISLDEIDFLKFCENIEELYIEGNPGITLSLGLRQIVQHRLPGIKILDGLIITPAVTMRNNNGENYQNSIGNEVVANEDDRSNFSIDFPPRVFFQRFFNN
ncbi:leucine-rich repeat-containing protein 56-like isoform X2 [Diabrotica undecimpunctata]|uniref:leucine-rich repeat-containing protein 56-like isoform X2 n=1 Tax=Diabrotica undecimpunctata TaxID=50387 RepID=UPI003B63B87A